MSELAKDFRAKIFSPITVISWALLSFVVAYAGPFGTYGTTPFVQRGLYWSAVMGFCVLTGQFVRVLVVRWLGKESFFRVSIITAFLMAALLAQPLRLASTWAAKGTNIPIPPYFETALIIFVSVLAVGALRLLLSETTDAKLPDGEAPVPASVDAQQSDAPRLLQRLEPGLRGEIIRLEVDDHYVTVVTKNGICELLMRMVDAIDEVEGMNGMRVHRSHWVCFDAVVGYGSENGRLILSMSDGCYVPVSRSQRPQVVDQLLDLSIPAQPDR